MIDTKKEQEAQELAQYDYYVDNLTGSKLLKLKGLSNAEDYILKYNLTNTTSGRTVNMIVFDFKMKNILIVFFFFVRFHSQIHLKSNNI